MATETEIRAFYEEERLDSIDRAPKWELSDRIRKIRRLQGMTQDAFASAVEVAPGTLRSWESGNSDPSSSDLLLFSVRCQVRFGVPAWWTQGLDGPANALDDPDPRMRATVLVVLEGMMASRRLAVESPGGKQATLYARLREWLETASRSDLELAA